MTKSKKVALKNTNTNLIFRSSLKNTNISGFLNNKREKKVEKKHYKNTIAPSIRVIMHVCDTSNQAKT